MKPNASGPTTAVAVQRTAGMLRVGEMYANEIDILAHDTLVARVLVYPLNHALSGKANAAFIVRSWNAHDALVAALERTLNWLTSYPAEGAMGKDGPYEQARAALALAQQP